MSEPPQFHLPDLLTQWPWPRVLNQHYEEAKRESGEWFRGCEALDPKSQRSFDRINTSLLCGLGYPSLDKDCLRVASDLIAFIFFYDEYTDKLDEDGARTCADLVMDAAGNPHKERPQGEPKIGEITRDFWLRAIKVSSEAAQRRFLASLYAYVHSVTDDISDRIGGRVREINDYLEIRKNTIGVYVTYFCVELGLDIPDEIMTHPTIGSLRVLAADSAVLTNDLYSYNSEQASGHGGHNILTVVMNENNVDLDGALDWVAEYNADVLSKFLVQRRTLPSWGPDMDRVVTTFIERLAYFIRGHDSWSFESERYFGTKGLEIQKRRMVTLLPRSRKAGVTPMMMAQTCDLTF